MQDSLVDLYTVDNNGMTVVHFMSRSKITTPDQLRRLIENDAHCLAVRDDLGYLPTHYALMRGNSALSLYLLERGIIPTTGGIGATGASLLHAAVKSSRTDVIDLALRHSACIQDVDDQGRSAVHATILVDNAAAIGKVAELGATDLLRRPDSRGETPLQLSQRVRAKSCVALLGLMGVVDTTPTVLTGPVPRVQKSALAMALPTPAFQVPPVVWLDLLFAAACTLLLYKIGLK